MTDFSLYLVTDPQLGGGPSNVAAIVREAIEGGVSVVQLRDKLVDDLTFRNHAIELRDICTAHNVPLFINDRIEIAIELGLHLHIGQSDIAYVEARRSLPAHLKLGLSIENLDQLETVISQCADAHISLPDVIGIGPVEETTTKLDAAPVLGVEGVAAISALATSKGISSVAIGGVDNHNIAALANTDISGICVVSAIFSAESPRTAAQQLDQNWKAKRMNQPSRPRVLSIAGTDPTGGAGIQADLKSIAAAGGYGMAVVTSLLAQNTQGVRSIHTPPLSFLSEQLDSVFSDVQVDAIKLGMLGNADTILLVSQWLKTHVHGLVVLDPVMVATSGDRLLEPDAEDAMRLLAREVDVITPNIPELAVLVDTPEATTMAVAITQACSFATANHVIVIVKGGHLDGTNADNAVVHPDGSVHRVENPRVSTSNTHGTGCSLSSALTTRLAAGSSIESALTWTTRWLNESLRNGTALHVGQGNGPIDHSHTAQRMLAAAETTPWKHLQQPLLSGTSADQIAHLATRKSPIPHIPAAGSFTAALWESAGDIIAQINSSDFIRGLGAGTLIQRDFHFYLTQDAHYLSQYSRALAALSAKSPSTQDQVAWAQGAAECIVVEAELHRSYLNGVPKSAPSPVTMAYTDFLIARAFADDYVVAAAAVLPCYWLYAEIGLALAAQNHSDHPFSAWLDTYSGEDFITGTHAAIARVEATLAAASPQQRVNAAQAFLSACAFEGEFFDQALREGWL